MNFFLVDSPLQLLNALEAKKYFKISDENSILIIFEGVSIKSFEQIQYLSKETIWAEIFLISKNKWSALRIGSLFKLDSIVNSFKEVEKIFIGEYRSNLMRHFVNSTSYKDCFLLDDGNASVIIHRKINSGKGIRDELTLNRKLVHTLTNLNDGDIFDIKYFTIYKPDNVQSNKYTVNKYEYIKSKISEHKIINEVYFLGNCLPELDIISHNDYLKNLSEIKEHYSSMNIIYIPHRREKQKKVKQIETELGFDLLELGVPIEWALVQGSVLPKEIASFYSSALDNCYEIFRDKIEIKSFKIPKNIIKENERKKFNLIYEEYEKYGAGFTIVDI